jgi:lysophospholipase L1-like esterase
MKRKVIAMVLISFMVTLLPLQALALKPEGIEPPLTANPVNYLNLGDSIAYGMSAEKGQSYFDLYSAYKQVGASVDLSVPGATTGDLLDALETNQYQNAVKRADVVIISIGGNNLLKPIQSRVAEILGVTDLTDTTAVQESIQDLTDELSEIYYPVPVTEQDALDWLAAELITEAGTPLTPLNTALVQGTVAFGLDMVDLFSDIRGLHPDATIIFLNLYNPFEYAESPELYGLYESIAGPMNLLLNSFNVPAAGSFVADIYTAFQPVPEAVDFSLALDTVNLDIHPTTAGHSIIFDELTALDIVDEFQPPKAK